MTRPLDVDLLIDRVRNVAAYHRPEKVDHPDSPEYTWGEIRELTDMLEEAADALGELAQRRAVCASPQLSGLELDEEDYRAARDACLAEAQRWHDDGVKHPADRANCDSAEQTWRLSASRFEAARLKAGVRAALTPQHEETKEDTRVGPSVPCVETAGSTAEQSLGAVTAAERTERPIDTSHLLVNGRPQTLAEKWAEEDEERHGS